MTREEAITVLENEVKCVLRDSCERSECASCDLVMPVEKILSAYDMAISALREQEERENPKPLTLDELLEMNEEPVWIILFDADEEFWALRYEWFDTRNPEPMILFHMRWYSHTDYGKTWLAYRSKPKEA